MRNENINWIVFDADDTLLDFKAAQKEAFTRMLLSLGFEDRKDYLETYNRLNRGLWRALERGEIQKQELIEKRFRLFCDHYDLQGFDGKMKLSYEEELSKRGDIIAGAREVLEELSMNYPLALASNGILSIQRGRLDASGIRPYFDEIIISEETGFEKPQKGFFDIMMSRIGQDDPKKILFIGDSLPSDMLGAVNYGLLSCWYNPGENVSTLKVDYIVTSLEQIPALVKNLVI